MKERQCRKEKGIRENRNVRKGLKNNKNNTS